MQSNIYRNDFRQVKIRRLGMLIASSTDENYKYIVLKHLDYVACKYRLRDQGCHINLEEDSKRILHWRWLGFLLNS